MNVIKYVCMFIWASIEKEGDFHICTKIDVKGPNQQQKKNFD